MSGSGTTVEERAFTRSLESLTPIADFIAQFFDRASLDASMQSTIQLSVEELFTNTVKYNAEGPDTVQLQLAALDDGGICVQLTDHEREPFDVTRVPPADTGLPLEARPIGKLGIHLVRTIVDELDFEHVDGRSTITFTKRPD